MRILITGSNGFIGQHLIRNLSKKHDILQVDFRRIKARSFYKVDLTSSKQTQLFIQKLRRKKIDVIIHLGAKMCSSKSSREDSLLKDNLAITNNMITVAEKLKPKVFVNASSIAVYPNESGEYREDSDARMAQNADCLYGLAKWNAEILFDHFLHDIVKVIHLRFAQVIGPGMRQDRIIPVLIEEIMRNNTATLYGRGKRVVNFLHVDDVVTTIGAVIKAPKAGIYNVGCAEHITMYQLAKRLIRIYGDKKAQIKLVSKGSKVKQRINSDKLFRTFRIRCQTFNLHGIEA